MFVYTVYPTLGTQKKRTSRRVEPVSRVSPVHPVERAESAQDSGFFIPEIQKPRESDDSHAMPRGGYVNKDASDTGRNKNDREWREGDLFIQNTMTVLLAWRYPASKISPDYIQKHCERLHSARA